MEGGRAAAPPGLPPTIEFSGEKGDTFSVQITAIPSRGGDSDFNSPAKLKKIAETLGGRMLSGSKEAALALEELKGDKAAGYVYTLTDKDPAPGSFEYITGGAVGVGDLILSVTILHHHKDAPERQAALDMLKGAKQAKAAPATQPAELRVPGPRGAAWDLVLPVKGLEVVEDDADDPRVRHLTAVDKSTGLIVSVFMEPAPQAGDSAAVRDVYWGRAKQSPLKKEGVTLGKAGPYATVQYTVPDVGGEKIDQRNANLYIAHEGVWVDVHVSKMKYADKDKPLFDAVVNGAKIEKRAGATKP